MEIETYEVTEQLADGTTPDTEEYKALVERLGLEGQSAFLSGEGGVVPYRAMTAEERFAYSQMCPKAVEVGSYRDGPIPVRVLQVCEHAKSLGHFDAVLVWAPETPTEKDPVLVGRVGGEYDITRRFYILARWGSELDAFPTVLKNATERWKAKTKAKLQTIMNTVKGELASVDTMDPTLAGRADEPQYYGLRIR